TVPKLTEIDLSNADLRGANLQAVRLLSAILNGANLTGVDLSKSDLRRANLSGAQLIESNLSFANLYTTNFNKANLRNASLSETDLTEACFRNADLQGADFIMSKLIRADLSGANLIGADLRLANLYRSNFTNAILTDVKLWESQRPRWVIKNVVCESVFWDDNAGGKTYYQPGEFEKLYGQTHTILLRYDGGISPLEITTLPVLIQKLQEKEGVSLRLKSIEETSGGSQVTVVVENPEAADRLKHAVEALPQQQRAMSREDIRQIVIEEIMRLPVGNTTNINIRTMSGGQLAIGDQSTNINNQQVTELAKAVEKIPPDEKSGFTDGMKNLLVTQLKELAAEEIKQLSKDAIAALK
ncbi:MAG TPA: pentapeptide repeat-containing protein, partial [Gammaproteobacteria bacterium]